MELSIAREIELGCQEAARCPACLLAQCLRPLACGYPVSYVLAEMAEDPCLLKWWVQLVQLVVRVLEYSEMPKGSLLRDILRTMYWMLLPSLLHFASAILSI